MNDTPAMGHNLPDNFAALEARTDELIAGANRAAGSVTEITDEETADRFKDFLEQLLTARNEVDGERKTQKQPHLDAGKAVDDRFKPLLARLDTAKGVLNPRLTTYMQAKKAREDAEARRLAEEAERKRKEAEEAAAAAEAAEGDSIVDDRIRAQELEQDAATAKKVADQAARAPTRVRGDYSKRAAGLRTTYKGRITDPDAVWRQYKHNAGVRDALQKAVNADIRAGKRGIYGVEVYAEQTAA